MHIFKKNCYKRSFYENLGNLDSNLCPHNRQKSNVTNMILCIITPKKLIGWIIFENKVAKTGHKINIFEKTPKTGIWRKMLACV